MKSIALTAIGVALSLAAVAATAAPGDIFHAGAAAEKLWGEGRFTEGVERLKISDTMNWCEKTNAS